MPRGIKRYTEWVLEFMEMHKEATARQIEISLAAHYMFSPGVRAITRILITNGFDIVDKHHGRSLWGARNDKRRRRSDEH